MRQPKGSDIGEIRLYIDGRRVGVMRVAYPAIVPAAPGPAPQMGQKPAIAPEAIRICLGREFAEQARITNGVSAQPTGQSEGNEWCLGRTLLLEDAVPEDLVLLLYHLVSHFTFVHGCNS